MHISWISTQNQKNTDAFRKKDGTSDHNYKRQEKELRMKSKLVLINLITESCIEIILNQVTAAHHGFVNLTGGLTGH